MARTFCFAARHALFRTSTIHIFPSRTHTAQKWLESGVSNWFDDHDLGTNSGEIGSFRVSIQASCYWYKSTCFSLFSTRLSRLSSNTYALHCCMEILCFFVAFAVVSDRVFLVNATNSGRIRAKEKERKWKSHPRIKKINVWHCESIETLNKYGIDGADGDDNGKEKNGHIQNAACMWLQFAISFNLCCERNFWPLLCMHTCKHAVAIRREWYMLPIKKK